MEEAEKRTEEEVGGRVRESNRMGKRGEDMCVRENERDGER